MSTKNLWGDLPVADNIRTPYSLVLEQATFLEKMSQGLLIGRLDRELASGNFHITLKIVAPSLSNYQYSVLRIRHDVGLYPLEIIDLSTSVSQACEDEGAFINKMEAILTSEKVRRVVTGLLAQIQGEE